jgi:SAM-dependent methyltransferase
MTKVELGRAPNAGWKQQLQRFRSLGRSVIPRRLRRAAVRATRWPPVGTVDFGDFAGTSPISRSWGGDRGTPVDRHYIGQFLQTWKSDVRGRVLEIGNNEYTKRYGKARVERSEVLHARSGNPKATYVDDLMVGATLPVAAFDCVICTQTLNVIPDLPAALTTLHRILKPGGVLLATVPGISKVYQDEDGVWGDYWHLTIRSADWLAQQAFGPAGLTIESRGNALSATAFIQGLAAEELTPAELDVTDPAYPVSIGLRAVKAS